MISILGFVFDVTTMILVGIGIIVALFILFSARRLHHVMAIIGQKIDKALGAIDSPVDKLDRAYANKQMNIRRIGEGIVSMLTVKERLSSMNVEYTEKAKSAEHKAKKSALENNRELAEISLKKKKLYEQTVTQNEKRIADLDKQTIETTKLRDKAQTDLELFSAKKEVIKGRLAVGEGMNSILRDLKGLSATGEDTGALVEDIEDRVKNIEFENTAVGKIPTESNTDLDDIDVSDELERIMKK